ncbi:cation efflux family-domain-containing protein [Dimargaris cristalligena]|uniref:Cation efflux family-domain-containing protein n=1 Tax=Dimargaris cristalligena TaxID=215637 RepID=A0A4P9ZPL0_9FUNG|nr:cation efflux family-domain-containing protein [Dimargaris cristalligena]|eukprot:RKP34621.1 cation efflux family-domain-containing protein [Dimargaris cristalligena]
MWVKFNSPLWTSIKNLGSPFYDPLKLSDRFKSPEELERIRKTQPGPVYDFYVSQNSHIEELLFTSPENRISGQSTPFENSLQAQLENDFEAEEARLRKVQWAVHLSVGANVVLFLVQLAAAISSGSLSLFATMADAFMDLLSSVILLMTSWAMAKRNQVKYPTGKARLETGGIIVFSSLMATLSVQLIVESIKSLISGEHEQNVTWFSIISIMGAWVTKFGLYLYCQALNKYPSARILAQDHFNDLIVNAFGLTMCLLGTHMSWWIDPVGGILVALIILRSWSLTAFEHVILIVGKTADPAFLQKITYIALTHDPRIMEIDTCRAYHLGHNLYVEVDIVMPPETPLHVSHDIGESLQFKLEKLDNVERAFVHVDYESEHHPEHNGERSV